MKTIGTAVIQLLTIFALYSVLTSVNVLLMLLLVLVGLVIIGYGFRLRAAKEVDQEEKERLKEKSILVLSAPSMFADGAAKVLGTLSTNSTILALLMYVATLLISAGLSKDMRYSPVSNLEVTCEMLNVEEGVPVLRFCDDNKEYIGIPAISNPNGNSQKPY